MISDLERTKQFFHNIGIKYKEENNREWLDGYDDNFCRKTKTITTLMIDDKHLISYGICHVSFDSEGRFFGIEAE